MNINDWLDKQPEEHEIRTNADGTQFIPIAVVEQLLDDMTGKTWGLQNFKFQQWGGIISGSVELIISYNHFRTKGVGLGEELYTKRILVGAATLEAHDYPDNADWEATILSEAIKNAAKKLGNRFGRSLNGRLESPKNGLKTNPVKLIPDKGIRLQYAKAVAAKNEDEVKKLESMYSFEN